MAPTLRHISIGALFNMLDVMRRENNRWRVSVRGPVRLAERSEELKLRGGDEPFLPDVGVRFQFQDEVAAKAFVEQKVLAAGLASLGLIVKGLP